MAEITTGSFDLAGAIPGDPSVGWRLERGPVTFRADLRLKDDQFVVAVQRGEVTLSRGDALLVDYRAQEVPWDSAIKEDGGGPDHGHSREGASPRDRIPQGVGGCEHIGKRRQYWK